MVSIDHRGGNISVGLMDDRRGFHRVPIPAFYGFSAVGNGISLKRAITGA